MSKPITRADIEFAIDAVRDGLWCRACDGTGGGERGRQCRACAGSGMREPNLAERDELEHLEELLADWGTS